MERKRIQKYEEILGCTLIPTQHYPLSPWEKAQAGCGFHSQVIVYRANQHFPLGFAGSNSALDYFNLNAMMNLSETMLRT